MSPRELASSSSEPSSDSWSASHRTTLWRGIVLSAVGYLLARRAWARSRSVGSCPRGRPGSQAGHDQFPGPTAHCRRYCRSSQRTRPFVFVSNNSVQHYSVVPRCGSGCRSPPRCSPGSGLAAPCGPGRSTVIERRAVLLIAAPVALFVSCRTATRRLGAALLYEVGAVRHRDEAGARHGWLPWRDVVLSHGILGRRDSDGRRLGRVR